MPFPNPFTNAPRLPSSRKRSEHSRSPSHSPVRPQARDVDPLLRDLSPSATFRAFTTDPDAIDGHAGDALSQSIRSSSRAERALGARAAKACLDLRSWVEEMENWEWPGTLETPEEHRTQQARMGGVTTSGQESEGEEYWACLPARIVQQYEQRADEIGQQLDEIDVEELKDYVLTSYYRTASRPPSSSGNIVELGATMNLKRLDDYTALVTATILQALPYLSRLSRLLDVWTVRLIILRSAPTYLRDLKRAGADLDTAWAAIAVSPTSLQNTSPIQFTRSIMEEMKETIEMQVGSLGRRLDRFLDDLEGREETVPDLWIEEFELLESGYGAWVVQAERKVQELEWRGTTEQTGLPPIDEVESPMTEAQRMSVDVSELENPALDNEAVVQPPLASPRQDVWPLAGPLNSNPPDPLENDTDAMAENLTATTSPESVAAPMIVGHLQPLPADYEQASSRASSTASPIELPGRHDTPLSAAGPKLDTSESSIKKRAAFLNDIERTNSLKQSKSAQVVRPFEHASNAFTRLFKKDKAPDPPRPKISRPISLRSTSGDKEDDQDSPIARQSLSPVAGVASKFNAMHLESLNSSMTSLKRSKEDVRTPSIGRDISPRGPFHRTPSKTDSLRSSNTSVTNGASPRATMTVLTTTRSTESNEPPRDWPLPAPASVTLGNGLTASPISTLQERDPEMHVSRVPMPTDIFDRGIIQDMPGRHVDVDDEEEKLRAARLAAQQSFPWSDVAIGPAASSKSGSHDSIRSGRSEESARLQADGADIDDSVAELEARPVITLQTSHGGDDKHELNNDDANDSAPSSPVEIVEAQSIGVFTVRPATDVSQSRSESTESALRNHSTASSVSLRPAVARILVSDSKKGVESASVNDEAPTLIKRASMASIESFSRGDIKSVDVSKLRRRSTAGTNTPSVTSPLAATNPSTPSLDKATADYFGPKVTAPIAMDSSPNKTSARISPESQRSRSSSASSFASAVDVLPSRPAPEGSPALGSSTAPPLNAAMTKRQNKQEEQEENAAPSISSPVASPKKKSAAPLVEDSFDRHVSEVLQQLPTAIRFKARPGAETPVSRQFETRSFSGPRPKNMRTPSRTGTMTIAPAEVSPKKHSASEPEVKLYHLTQAGREDPIKLYVRLVGENERVMVRVGGGWADLAEYLRQYAEHHGSRTVAEGNNLEVSTINGTSSGLGSRKSSIAADSRPRGHTNASNRPTSRDGPRASGDWPEEPNFDSGGDTPTDDVTHPLPILPSTPNAHHLQQLSTPKGSRPSTADANANGSAARPSSRQSVLAGSGRKPGSAPANGSPAASTTELSAEHKAKWVEGMLERAKKASAEKSRDDRDRYFGELGKAGTTRRVIFRSASGTGGPAAGREEQVKSK